MNEKNRFTISISKELVGALDQIKQEKYYNTSRNEMVNDLLKLGLEAYNAEKEKKAQ